MENASKALLMAAGMLIAILAASMFALLFSTMSDYSKQYEQTRQAQDIQEFNAQFTQYMKRNESTAQDIVSVYNLAEYYREKEGIEVEVTLNTNPLIFDETTNRKEDFIENNMIDGSEIKKFDAEIKNYDNGRIKEINFK